MANNHSYAFHIIRVGLATTFLWIGVIIFRDPAGWGGFLAPWAQDLLSVPPADFMLGVAVFDIVVGGLLLVGVWIWIASLLAALHLAGVLLVSGIDAVTVRDIGLLAAALALAIETWPEKWRIKKQPSFSPSTH